MPPAPAEPRLRCARLAAVLAVVLGLATPASAAVSSTVTSGLLAITLDAADDAVVTCAGGQTKVNGADPAPGPGAACTAVTHVTVTATGSFSNQVDLRGVDSTSTFPNFLRGSNALVVDPAQAGSGGYGIAVDLDAGDDTYFGSNDGLIDEVVKGGSGSDTFATGFGTAVMRFAGEGTGETDTLLITGAGTFLAFGVSTPVTVDLNGGVGGDPSAIASHLNRIVRRDPASTFNATSVVGGQSDDVIVGAAGSSTTFYVWSGNDSFTGGSEQDNYLFGYVTPPSATTATIVDPAGDNYLDFFKIPASNPITADFANGLGGGVLVHTLANDIVVKGDLATAGSFKRMFGTEGSDTVTGNAKDNIFQDCLGNDVYVGGQGNDTFNEMNGFLRVPGGTEFVDCGNDRYEGGPGDDIYQLACRAAAGAETKTVVELPGEGRDTIFHSKTTCVAATTSTFDLRSDGQLVRVGPSGGPARQTIQTGAAGQAANFEDVVAGGNADALTGNDANNHLTALGLNTLVAGGPGDDTFSGGTVTYAAAPGPVHVNYVTGVATGEGTDNVAGTSRLIGSPFADTIIGKSGSLILSGGGGNDTMFADFNNVANGDAGNDEITLGGGATANGGADDDTLIATLFTDTLNGDAGNDTFIVDGGLHHVNGGAGTDTIDTRNERPDDVVDCGADADIVRADQGDTLAASCESVNPGGTGGPPDTTALALVSCGSLTTTLLGASADGSRVFVSTKEALVPTDVDTALDLYELTADGVRLVSGGTTNVDAVFDRISTDGTRVFFETPEALPGTGDADDAYDVYERADGVLRLISGGSTNSDAFFGGATPDGSHVWFTTNEALLPTDTDTGGDLYERHGTALALVSGPDPAPNTFAGFGGATSDGSKVWFTTNKSLLPADTDTFQDVYERAGDTLTLISGPGFGFFTGFVGASADGTHVYFVSDKALASSLPGTGESHAVGNFTLGLYERASGTLTLIGTGLTLVGVSPDSSRIVVRTQEQLLPADTDGAFDLYRRENGVLTLLSGGSEDRSANAMAVSADATRVVFETTEALLPADTDVANDVYLNDAGTLVLVSPGTADIPADFKGAASDSTRVFFRTAEALLPEDTDTGIDVYEWSNGTLALRAGGTGNVTTFFGGSAAGGDVVFFASDEALLSADGDATRDLYAVGPSGFPAAPVCTAIVPDEVCDNCLDDDGDGAIDRGDPDCPAPADGAGGALPDPKTLGKAAVKCQKTLGKAGAKLAAAKLKQLQACAQSAFVCLQQKPDDDTCVAKASAKCGKALAGLGADRAKLSATVAKACGPPALELADLTAEQGLGFVAETEPCNRRGVTTLDSVDDIATCVGRTSECRAEALFGVQVPRAAELLAAVGRDAGVDAPCVGPSTDGGGQHLGTPGVEGKAAAKCAKNFAKAGAKLAGQEQKTLQKCAGVVAVCVQQKNGDPGCLTKARGTCGKLFTKLPAVEAKLAASLGKSCAGPAVDVAGVVGPAGLGFTAHAADCAALGVPTLTTLTDVATCATRLHQCRSQQLVENQTPRLRELLDLGAVPLP